MVDIYLFSRSKGSNVDPISGFFTSNIAWIPFKFPWLLLPHTLGERKSWPWHNFKVTEVKLWFLSLGFVQISISHIAWIPFELHRIVALDNIIHYWKKTADLNLLPRPQESNFPPAVTLLSDFLQGICRPSSETLLDSCLQPPRVQKGRLLTLTCFHGHRCQIYIGYSQKFYYPHGSY